MRKVCCHCKDFSNELMLELRLTWSWKDRSYLLSGFLELTDTHHIQYWIQALHWYHCVWIANHEWLASLSNPGFLLKQKQIFLSLAETNPLAQPNPSMPCKSQCLASRSKSAWTPLNPMRSASTQTFHKRLLRPHIKVREKTLENTKVRWENYKPKSLSCWKGSCWDVHGLVLQKKDEKGQFINGHHTLSASYLPY